MGLRNVHNSIGEEHFPTKQLGNNQLSLIREDTFLAKNVLLVHGSLLILYYWWGCAIFPSKTPWLFARNYWFLWGVFNFSGEESFSRHSIWAISEEVNPCYWSVSLARKAAASSLITFSDEHLARNLARKHFSRWN